MNSTKQYLQAFKAQAVLLALVFLLPAVQGWAQCAMCAATVESNQKAGQASIATSLNTGILYMMIVPYILFGTIAFFWYKNAKKQKAVAAAKAEARARAKAALQA